MTRGAYNTELSHEDRLEIEAAELRRQLAERDEQISDLIISSDTYFAERNSARDVWRRASKDRDELRRQLAERDAALKEIQSVAESAVKTHGYDKAHVRVADIAKRATGPKP